MQQNQATISAAAVIGLHMSPSWLHVISSPSRKTTVPIKPSLLSIFICSLRCNDPLFHIWDAVTTGHPDRMTSRALIHKGPKSERVCADIGCGFPSVASWKSVSTTTIWAICGQFCPFSIKPEGFKGSTSPLLGCLQYPTHSGLGEPHQVQAWAPPVVPTHPRISNPTF